MRILIGVAITFLCVEMAVVAWLAARPLGARIGSFISVLSLAVPLFVQASPFPHALVAIGFLWSALRSWDLVHESVSRPFLSRFVHLFAVIDTRAISHGRRHFSATTAVRLLAWVGASVILVLVVRAADSFTGWPHYVLRWSGGAGLLLTGFETLVAAFESVLAMLGWIIPPLHDAPHRSLTIAEFWGERWNRIVGRFLNERVFRPLARRSPWLGITAAFAVSAAMHAYIIGVALGIPAALAWAAFFLAQPLLLAAERWLHVRRWPAVAGWSWTVGLLLLLSPLMTEPGLRLFAQS